MKKRLSSKGWLLSFIACSLLIAALWAAFNVYLDPFGAFGTQNGKTWWSYEETLNPRVAKISYLEKHHDKYDSYILGSSSCSSWPVEFLNERLGANFYNLINYGMDPGEMQELAEYVIENYKVKNLFLSLYIGSADTKGEYEQTLSYSNHYKVNGSSALNYFAKYLFAHPSNALKKLGMLKKDGYIPAAYDCFNAETGAYDKRFRDIERISGLEEYIGKDAYAVFGNYPEHKIELPYIENIAEAVANIKNLCEERGIRLIVASVPVYAGNLAQFDSSDVERFEELISKAAGELYHSYMQCPGTDDPRFFYDATHFRNALGEACLKHLFDGSEIKVGEEAALPAIMYHSLDSEGGAYSTAPENFERHLQALRLEGYTSISLAELKAFALGEGSLPEKPVLITFDDGYENNYSRALPLLEKYNAKAAFFVIGKSVGKSIYDDGKPMTPHFGLAEALEMEASGFAEVQSHSYNMHQAEGRDPVPVRRGVLKLDSESEREYINNLVEDVSAFAEKVKPVYALSYPEGLYSELAELVFAESGISISFCSENRVNTIVQGLPQSLRLLGRFDVGALSAEEMLELISK